MGKRGEIRAFVFCLVVGTAGIFLGLVIDHGQGIVGKLWIFGGASVILAEVILFILNARKSKHPQQMRQTRRYQCRRMSRNDEKGKPEMSQLSAIVPFLFYSCLLGVTLFLAGLYVIRRKQYPPLLASFIRRFTLSIPLVMIAWAFITTYSPGKWLTDLCFVLIFLFLGILYYPPIKRMGEERKATRRRRD